MSDSDGEKTKATSWSGSEDSRREQGVCLPPTKPVNRTPRYLVKAGTKVAVSKVTPLRWVTHTTRQDLGFESHEGYDLGHYTFRHQGWLIAVSRANVVHRDDSPRE